jgi:hypothetical protein
MFYVITGVLLYVISKLVTPIPNMQLPVYALSEELFGVVRKQHHAGLDKREVDWYFGNMMREARTGILPLGSFVIVLDEQFRRVIVPHSSLQLLNELITKWAMKKTRGEAKQFVGTSVEEVFFNMMHCFELNTHHPISKKPLLGFKDPTMKYEFDVMGYDSRQLAVIECKFWDVPLIQKLEEEMNRFQRRLEYLQQNLGRLGFDVDLQIIPIFYTPYAPRATWGTFTVMPSFYHVIVFLSRYFPRRKVVLTEPDPRAICTLDLARDVVLYPRDAAEFDTQLPKNIYRIQDLLVQRIDNDEVAGFVENNLGTPIPLFLDISRDMYECAKDADLQSGDIIRALIANLNGRWSLIQLMAFRVLCRWKDLTPDLAHVETYRRLIAAHQHISAHVENT